MEVVPELTNPQLPQPFSSWLQPLNLKAAVTTTEGTEDTEFKWVGDALRLIRWVKSIAAASPSLSVYSVLSVVVIAVSSLNPRRGTLRRALLPGADGAAPSIYSHRKMRIPATSGRSLALPGET